MKINDKKSLIDTKAIKEYYTFHHVDSKTEEEVYFCNCGKKITKENNVNKTAEFKVTLEDNKYYSDVDVYDKIDGTAVTCPKCDTDYSKAKNFQRIKASNHFFYGSFKFEETEDRLTLYKIKIKSSCTLKSKFVRFKEEMSYLSVDKKTKKLFIKGYEEKEESEFNLDNVVKFVESFYGNDNLNIMDNLIDVHRFLNNLAGLVVDSDNMDIVDGLMSQMVGKPGMDVLKNINTIFFGIICYSNLSTIALTKGVVFLNDMMRQCPLPNPKALSDNGVTSPLKIFNFLVTLENKEAQEEIESEKSESNDFVYKSKEGKSLNINFDLERFGFSRSSNVDMSSGRINVREDLKHKTVSKYIFNKIDKFDDYKKLIRFTKFIKYEELIVLVMKYDTKLLTSLFDIVEFRDDINLERLNQIIPLILDSLKSISSNSNGHLVRNQFLAGIVEEEVAKEVVQEVVEEEDVKIDYSLMSRFNFHEYDDSVRMIEELNWERSKEFDKIKKMSDLRVYHSKLVEHYNMLSDKDKYDKFKKFAVKFNYLEKYKDILKLKVLSTPTMVLNAAKDMKNCAGSYVTRISQAKYILIMVWDKSKKRKKEEKDYFMMGLNVTSAGLEFDQFKGVCNHSASDRQKKLIMTYLKSKDISFRELRDLRLSSENKGTQSNNDFNLFGG